MSRRNNVKNYEYSFLVKNPRKTKNLKNSEKKVSQGRQLYILLTNCLLKSN